MLHFFKNQFSHNADESCIVESDVLKYKHFHGVKCKLMKCGITPAKRMIEQTRQLGLKQW
jgi:hypothetical protein